MNEDTAAIFDKICGLDTPELESLLKAIDGLKIELEYRAWITEVDKAMGILLCRSTADFPDFQYAEWFQRGVLPGMTAHMACQAIMKTEKPAPEVEF